MLQSRTSLTIMICLSVAIALATGRIIPLGLEMSFDGLNSHLTLRLPVFLAHILGASAALALGGFQFIPALRKRALPLHRWIGRSYVVSVAIGGLSGLALGLNAIGGTLAAVGFCLLAVAWLTTTGLALWFVRTGKIAAHRRWMIRSFALTFAAVTLRLYLPLFFLGGWDYAEASVYLGWISWVPNLVFAEWYLRRVPNPA